MSIETFFANNKPGYEFKAWIISRANQESHPTNPISELAKMYRVEGVEQLKKLAEKIRAIEGNQIVIPNPQMVMSRLGQQDLFSWNQNALGLIFGCAIPVIESTVKEGWCEMDQFWGLYDFSVSGTILPTIAVERINQRVLLTQDQWGKLDGLIRQDPTYGCFLEESGISLLPPSLGEALDHSFKAFGLGRDEFKQKHRLLAGSLTTA